MTGARSPRKSGVWWRTQHRPCKLLPAHGGFLNVFSPSMYLFSVIKYIDSGTDMLGILFPFSFIHMENNEKRASYIIFAFDALSTSWTLEAPHGKSTFLWTEWRHWRNCIKYLEDVATYCAISCCCPIYSGPGWVGKGKKILFLTCIFYYCQSKISILQLFFFSFFPLSCFIFHTFSK